jgi:CDP-diacylglycerol---serine O-phosphatidyltransferase
VADTGEKSLWRFVAPNLFTTASLVFGLLSLTASHRGQFASAAWFIILCVLLDRVDGVVARLVKGTSELGMHLDSFADFLGFGLAPAFLMYTFLGAHPLLPFVDGAGHVALIAACAAWILAAAFRLARYNINADDAAPTKVFFGFPTTLAGGTLAIWFLALLKYSAPGPTFGGAKLLGNTFVVPAGVWWYFPLAMVIGAYLMVSSLRMPKVGLARSKAATVFVLANVAAGYILGPLRLFPEYLVVPPTAWILVFLVWGQVSSSARGMRPPPIFRREGLNEQRAASKKPPGASGQGSGVGGSVDQPRAAKS